MKPTTSSAPYLLGRTEAELQRLARQAEMIEPETRDLFRRAGICAGMDVLEIGSGAGDVAILAGRMVLPDGSVCGVERSAESVAVAASRVAANASSIRFEVADLNDYVPSRTYDALIGRFVLPYLDDPPSTLNRLAAYVRPGGVVAFMEFDVRQIGSVPKTPLLEAVATWIVGAYEARGIDPALGSALGALFRDAGLPWPYMGSVQKTSSGPNGIIWYFAELVRTLLPHIVEHGLASDAEVGIDNLESRLLDEATAARSTVFAPRWSSAWTQLPITTP